MKNMRSALLLGALVLFLAGCGGKAVPIGELSCGDVHTRVQKTSNGKTASFEYCINEEGEGRYAIQGNTQFESLGQITRATMKLYLVRDRKVVETVPLRVRATQMDKKVYFYKEFEYTEPFDYVAFGWNLRYRF